MSPERAILPPSPGRKPWVIIVNIFMSPKWAAQPRLKVNARAESAAPTELLFFLSMFTQGSVRAFGTLATLGYAGVSCLRHS